jgi:hypothetical protein
MLFENQYFYVLQSWQTLQRLKMEQIFYKHDRMLCLNRIIM